MPGYASRLLPVISAGFGKPMSSSSVGAMSQSAPSRPSRVRPVPAKSASTSGTGAVVCAVVSVIYAVAISGMGANYTEMQYYFDPTLPDVAMRQSEQITGAILAGEHAVAFWLGNIVVGCAVPAVLAALVMCGKVPAEKALAVAVIALVCAVIGTIVWRVLLYEVAVNALIQFQWALQ